jgi:hypothetical protein
MDFLTGAGGVYGVLVSPALTGYFLPGAGRAFGAGFDDGKALGAGFDDGRAFCPGLLSVFFMACFLTAPLPPGFGAVAFWIDVPYELMPLPTASNLPAMPSQKRTFVSMFLRRKRGKVETHYFQWRHQLLQSSFQRRPLHLPRTHRLW